MVFSICPLLSFHMLGFLRAPTGLIFFFCSHLHTELYYPGFICSQYQIAAYKQEQVLTLSVYTHGHTSPLLPPGVCTDQGWTSQCMVIPINGNVREARNMWVQVWFSQLLGVDYID